MELTALGPTGASVRPRLPLLRWGFLAALLFSEATLLSIRIDVVTLQDSMPQWWATLLSHTGWLLPVAAAVATATLLFSGPRLRDEMQAVFASTAQPRWSWWWLTAHLIAFASFARLTTFIFTEDLTGFAHPGWCGAGWVLLGSMSLACWALTSLPPAVLLPIVRRILRALPVGATIGIAAWAIGEISEPWWFVLQRAKLWLVQHMLSLVTSEVIVEPGRFVVGTPELLIEIAPSCAGGEGIGLISTFVLAYLWFFRDRLRFPQAFLLLPLGIAAAWLANGLRLVAIVLVGTWMSADVAFGGLHSHAGTVLFCALALGLAATAQHWQMFVRRDAGATPAVPNPTAAYLGPLLALIATALFTGALSPSSFDVLYPLRVVTAAAVLWHFRGHYRDWRVAWSWTAVALGVAIFALWIALAPAFADAADPAALRAELSALPVPWAIMWVVARAAGTVLVVPIAEELAFRGYLTRRLMAGDFERVPLGEFSWLSFAISSILFGAMHQHLFAGSIAGALYALTLYRRRQLGDAILAHATTNALLVLYVIVAAR